MMKSRPIPQVLRWVWRKARPIRPRLVCSCALGVVRVVLSLVFIWVSKDLVDAAVGHVVPRTLLRMSALLVALMLAEMAISLAVQYISRREEAWLKNDLRHQLFSHLMHSRWIDHHDVHSGDLLNRLTEDVRQISDVACTRLQQTVVMLAQFVGAFAVLCVLSWRLAMCVVFIMPFFVVLSKVYVRRTRSLTAEIRERDSAIYSSLQESIQHQPVIQTMECQEATIAGYDDLQRGLYDVTMARTRFSVFSRGMVQMGFIACYLTAFLWSVWSLYSATITFGVMTAFLQLVARLQMPVVNISQHIPAFVQALTSVDRLMDIEDLPDEPRSQCVPLDAPVGVRIEGLAFRYPAGDRYIFSDFSHDFAPGSKTVLMGETGVGKSTLVKLLLALLTPERGSLTLYDRERSVAVSAATRCNMVYVPQGNSLLAGTVRSNLLMARPDATDEQMRQALHLACADFVLDLPQGLDTRCGELGSALSEGQAQRIAIARALLRPGAVLLLDEFNSSLDMATAQTLMERLALHCRQRTIIFISHRPEVETFCTDTLRI